MKNIVRSSIAAISLGLAASAFAAPITGAISLAGAFTPTGGNINTATSFSSLGPAVATSTVGSFALAVSGINTILDAGADSSFAMTPFSYGTTAAPLLSPSPVLVWTTTNGLITTSFLLQSISVVDHNVPDQVGLIGSGIFSMTGFDDTYGTFNLTANQAQTTFSFSSSQQATNRVPDSGSTVLLLGSVLLAIGAISRRMKA
jgi:hypothetical protein